MKCEEIRSKIQNMEKRRNSKLYTLETIYLYMNIYLQTGLELI